MAVARVAKFCVQSAQ